VNIYKNAQLSLSSSGSVFALARLLDDGLALKFLDSACPNRKFKICEQLDYLKAYHVAQGNNPDPLISLKNHFLWRGPLTKLGGFRNAEAEARIIVYETVAAFPVEELRSVAMNVWRQLLLIHTSDILMITTKTEMSRALLFVFGQDVSNKFEQSNQYHSDTSF